jgi:hypothetical protein
LWRGTETRSHADLEIAILRREFAVFRARLHDFKFFVVGSGDVSPLAADAWAGAEKHQNWVLDDAEMAWRMDIFLEPGDRDTWVFRRDETISRPRLQMIAATADGVPYLNLKVFCCIRPKPCAQRTRRILTLALRCWGLLPALG